MDIRAHRVTARTLDHLEPVARQATARTLVFQACLVRRAIVDIAGRQGIAPILVPQEHLG